jgi:hypothetical protein
MNRIFIVMFAMIVGSLFLNATTPAEAATRILPGTIIPAELSKTIDARKVKAGDKIEIKTVVDLLSEGQSWSRRIRKYWDIFLRRRREAKTRRIR